MPLVGGAENKRIFSIVESVDKNSNSFLDTFKVENGFKLRVEGISFEGKFQLSWSLLQG